MKERDMTTPQETVPETFNFVKLGDLASAEGTIQGTPETHPEIDTFTDEISRGEYHVHTDIALPCSCIDGRPGARICPNAAGGTLSLVVADDLASRKFVGDGTTADAARRVFTSLHERGFPIGGHTADETHGAQNSGCGANDQLQKIYGIMARQSEQIRAIAETIGVAVDDETFRLIIGRAHERADDSFSTGRDVLDAMNEAAGPESVPSLHGGHGEVVAVINLRHGTTLDRDAIAEKHGLGYEAFNIDAWSFRAAAEALYPDADESELQATVAAMTYYNLATSLALCGPEMRVVVLEDESTTV